MLHIRTSLDIKFQLKLTILIFLDQKYVKKVLPVENRKSKHQHWILHIQISLCTKFQLKMPILIFWIKFAQTSYFRLKTEKVNINIEFWIFESVLVPNFSLDCQFWIFARKLPNKYPVYTFDIHQTIYDALPSGATELIL